MQGPPVLLVPGQGCRPGFHPNWRDPQHTPAEENSTEQQNKLSRVLQVCQNNILRRRTAVAFKLSWMQMDHGSVYRYRAR